MDIVDRLRDLLLGRPGVDERRMFGGICFHLNGHVCCGVYKTWLIARVGAQTAESLLEEPGCTPMDITGKPMRGWVKLEKERGLDEATSARFVADALAFVGSLPPKA
jgi:hypothetical protein